MSTSIEVLNSSEINARVAAHLYSPLENLTNTVAIDCADERELTTPVLNDRARRNVNTRFTAGFFGAAGGFALVYLADYAIYASDSEFKSLVKDAGPDLIPNMATELTERAHEQSDHFEMTVHSAEDNEGTPDGLAETSKTEKLRQLGCAFLASMGTVLDLSVKTMARLDARRIDILTGSNLKLSAGRLGLDRLGTYLPAAYSVSREDLVAHSLSRTPHLHVSMMRGQHASNDQAKVTIDMAGFARNSSALIAAGKPRYQHTTSLAAAELPNFLQKDGRPEALIPGHRFDGDRAEAIAMLLGTATRQALSGPTTPDALGIEVIPRSYN